MTLNSHCCVTKVNKKLEEERENRDNAIHIRVLLYLYNVTHKCNLLVPRTISLPHFLIVFGASWAIGGTLPIVISGLCHFVCVVRVSLCYILYVFESSNRVCSDPPISRDLPGLILPSSSSYPLVLYHHGHAISYTQKFSG